MCHCEDRITNTVRWERQTSTCTVQATSTVIRYNLAMPTCYDTRYRLPDGIIIIVQSSTCLRANPHAIWRTRYFGPSGSFTLSSCHVILVSAFSAARAARARCTTAAKLAFDSLLLDPEHALHAICCRGAREQRLRLGPALFVHCSAHGGKPKGHCKAAVAHCG